MVRHGTARHMFCSHKTVEAIQVEPRSNSNFYGSARRYFCTFMYEMFDLVALEFLSSCALSEIQREM